MLVGGSYIACEVAASLTAPGQAVHAGDAGGRRRCRSASGRTAGEFFAGVLRDHGDRLGRAATRSRASRATAARAARRDRVRPRSCDADLVVMGTGAVPDVMLARSAGLELGETGGIACSSTLETSARGRVGGRRRVRVRLRGPRPPAADRALGGRARPGRRASARAIRGERASRTTRSRTSGRTSRTGARSSTSARPRAWDREVVRGSIDDGEFTIFYLAGGRVRGGADRRPLRRPRPRARADDASGEPVDFGVERRGTIVDALGRRPSDDADPPRADAGVETRASRQPQRRRRCRARLGRLPVQDPAAVGAALDRRRGRSAGRARW